MKAFPVLDGTMPGMGKLAVQEPINTSSTGPREVRNLGRRARVNSQGKMALRLNSPRSISFGIASILRVKGQ